jgi:septal ring factor EnvC (AmiA/AmiB activator)
MSLVKVKPFDGHEHLLKDTRNKAVINEDNKAFSEYISKRNKIREEEAFKYNMETKMQDVESDINNIKTDLSDIKNLLTVLVNK